ncbi:MAG: TraM recognition domain-containing protein, partial [Acidimicrobiales bacterium]
VRFVAGAARRVELEELETVLLAAIPGLDFGSEMECVARNCEPATTEYAFARNLSAHHLAPMAHYERLDVGSVLMRALQARGISSGRVAIQIIFERVPAWERHFWSARRVESIAQQLPSPLGADYLRRQSEAVYHVELRAGATTPWAPESRAQGALDLWMGQFLGGCSVHWRRFKTIPRRKQTKFDRALRGHDLTRFSNPKGCRDVSASELTRVLSIPWREQHPQCHYVGAPYGRPGPGLGPMPRGPPYASPSIAARPLAPLGTTPSSYAHFPRTSDPQGAGTSPYDENRGSVIAPAGVTVGSTRGVAVALPSGWHHLAILGRTRTGKSTLALNVALQLLKQEPSAAVVVLEPSGNLIRALVERVPPEIAGSIVEIDPSRPTLVRDGVETARVPLNLIPAAGSSGLEAAEVERRSERVVGDLIQAIKNAWGEESIGGRADFILRAVVQGLNAVPGTNLVDAYSVLSDRQTLRRLEELVEPGPLRDALRTHLPKLDHSQTISSLDKVGKIATNPLLRKALCQRFHSVSFAELLSHRLLLLNVAKSALGTEASNFLGAIFLTQLWSALQERASQHAPVYLIVDEFHNFAIPAFADMLSEGARHGLHVVAITQYLSRIPDKVRAAVIGNVDAWAFFSMGAEDLKEAWQIIQGGRFGWVPDHLASGLDPHQVAFAVRGNLLKVDTIPPPPIPATAPSARDSVRESSLRYAAPEDSEASPLAVSSAQVTGLLGAFPAERGTTRQELAHILGWQSQIVDAGIAVCSSALDLDAEGDRVALRSRGLRHLEALKAARNEGDLHTALLADAAVFLEERGIRVGIVPQESGFLQPDGEFEANGRAYHLEVECSTLSKHTDQLIRNVRKALVANRRCLTVVSDWEAAQRMAGLLSRDFPKAKLWGNVGLVW